MSSLENRRFQLYLGVHPLGNFYILYISKHWSAKSPEQPFGSLKPSFISTAFQKATDTPSTLQTLHWAANILPLLVKVPSLHRLLFLSKRQEYLKEPLHTQQNYLVTHSFHHCHMRDFNGLDGNYPSHLCVQAFYGSLRTPINYKPAIRASKSAGICLHKEWGSRNEGHQLHNSVIWRNTPKKLLSHSSHHKVKTTDFKNWRSTDLVVELLAVAQ